jgi:organic hydroperoxide reductase OsmC/OhrA
MPEFPHHYAVRASAKPEGDVSLAAERLTTISTAPPAEFGGPGDRWSPESLLVAAVADCFVLSFRAIAQASKVPWISLEAEASGTLDRVEKATRFTRMDVRATLRVPAGVDPARAERVLQRAEQTCFISNSLVCERHLEAKVESA